MDSYRYLSFVRWKRCTIELRIPQLLSWWNTYLLKLDTISYTISLATYSWHGSLVSSSSSHSPRWPKVASSGPRCAMRYQHLLTIQVGETTLCTFSSITQNLSSKIVLTLWIINEIIWNRRATQVYFNLIDGMVWLKIYIGHV